MTRSEQIPRKQIPKIKIKKYIRKDITMKNIKKLLGAILILAMLCSMSITAFAATNDSITVTNAPAGELYSIYKMFDLSVDDVENPTAYRYSVNEGWAAFFAEGGAGAEHVTIENGVVTEVKDVAELAKAAAAWEEKPEALATLEAGEDRTVKFDELDNGYYLITSTLGTVSMIRTTPAESDVTVEEKNPEDTIIKEVKEDSTGEYGKENDAQVGDTVEFKSEATLLANTTNVKIHDTMDEGLTYNDDVKIYVDDGFETELDSEYYEIQATPDEGETFTIKFTQEYLDTITESTTLYLKYTAVLNEKAIVKDENGVVIVDQYNKTKITYGNKQSVEDQTKTTTHVSGVNKYAEKIENLAGAEFALKKGGQTVMLVKLDDCNYRVATAEEIAVTENNVTVDKFVTVESGDILIWGLDSDDDYTLEELKAPEGYNKLAGDIEFTVTEDNKSMTDVENKSGTELPETGGIGTTIFYIAGGILVLAAVVFLVTRKRMGSNEE